MFSLRPAAPADLLPLAESLASLELFAAYGLGNAAVLHARWKGGMDRGDRFWIAEHSGQPAAICWWLPRGAFALAPYLRLLAVAPQHQGHGLGAKLLTKFEAETADSTHGWFLLVSEHNTMASSFYQRAGYVEAGRLPGFAAPNVTERVLWKPPPKTAQR